MNVESSQDLAALESRAAEAAEFLKSLANKHRLMILCALVERECSVGELVDKLGISQPNTSQHLLRLKAEGLIAGRRSGSVIYYRPGQRPGHADDRDALRPLLPVCFRFHSHALKDGPDHGDRQLHPLQRPGRRRLIGLSAALLMLGNGRIAGISGIVGGLFRPQPGEFGWRVAFLVGMLLGPAVVGLAGGYVPVPTFQTDTLGMIAAGLLVGFGTPAGRRLHQRPRSLRPGPPVAPFADRHRDLHGRGGGDRLPRPPRVRRLSAMSVQTATPSTALTRVKTNAVALVARPAVRRRPDLVADDRPGQGGRLPRPVRPLGPLARPGDGRRAGGHLPGLPPGARAGAAPWLAPKFAKPSKRDLDPRLIGGAVLFGVGWGASPATAPGPAVAGLALGEMPTVIFVVAMLAGMFVFHLTLEERS